MSALRYHDEVLWMEHPDGSQEAIDLVYRRAVTSDMVARLQELPQDVQAALIDGGLLAAEAEDPYLDGELALIEAVRQSEVCMAGSFQSQVAHAKQIFRVLRLPETFEFLEPGEQAFVDAHIPLTASLTTQEVDPEHIIAEKDNWILKPCDGYAARGVYAGLDFEPASWREVVQACLDHDYLVQRYVRPYETPNTAVQPPFADHLHPYQTLTGLYTCLGQFAGCYVRGGLNPVIAGFRGGLTMATLWAG
jgi:hypothetical protein